MNATATKITVKNCQKVFGASKPVATRIRKVLMGLDTFAQKVEAIQRLEPDCDGWVYTYVACWEPSLALIASSPFSPLYCVIDGPRVSFMSQSDADLARDDYNLTYTFSGL